MRVMDPQEYQRRAEACLQRVVAWLENFDPDELDYSTGDGKVTFEFADGMRLTERVTAVRGTPRNPMSRAEVIDKARDLIAPVLGREISDRLIEMVYAIEAVPDIRNLGRLLRRG